MPKFNEYTEKTNPDDADIFLLQDVVSTKKTTFLGIFNQIRTKLGLGALANKNKVSQSDLEDALTEFINGKLTASGIADDLNTTDITKVLSAPQGKALLGYIGTLSSLSTAQKTNLVVAINEVVTSVATLNSNLNAANFNLVNSTYYPVTNVIVSGRDVQLHCAGLLAKDVPANAELTIGTLPEAYRPPFGIIKYVLCSNSTNRLLRLLIDTDGKVTYTLTADTAKGVGVNINETFVARSK